MSYLHEQRAESGQLLADHNYGTLETIIGAVAKVRGYETKAAKYMQQSRAAPVNHTNTSGRIEENDDACWQQQKNDADRFTELAVAGEKICIDQTMVGLRQLTRQYFYTLTTEQFRQSAGSQHLALYAIGQYDPITDWAKVQMTLESTIRFSEAMWPGTMDNIEDELKRLERGAADSARVLRACDCAVIEDYVAGLRKTVCASMKC